MFRQVLRLLAAAATSQSCANFWDYSVFQRSKIVKLCIIGRSTRGGAVQFFQFRAAIGKNGKNNRLAHFLWG